MAERIVEYTTAEERVAALNAATAAGWVLKHDDFNEGQTKQHRLTFEDDYSVSAPVHPHQAAWDGASTDTDKITVLAQALGITVS